MLKIKLSNNFPYVPIQRQTPDSSGIWDDCIFLINQDVTECDFWIVYEDLERIEETICPPENLIFIAYEPPAIKTYNPTFLNQFSTVIACHKNICHRHVIYDHQSQPWLVNQRYDDLMTLQEVKKRKFLSLITSEKRTTLVHRQRHNLCLKLKEYFGEDVDLYGRGINDFADKWDVIAPYRYSLAVENSLYENYFTEKVIDCFLGETVPLYYGCPNFEDFFLAPPVININVFDPDATIQVIKKLMDDETHYLSFRERLREAKIYYLNYLNLFPRLVRLIHRLRQNQDHSSPAKTKIKLYPEMHPRFLGDRLIRKFNKVVLGKRYDY